MKKVVFIVSFVVLFCFVSMAMAVPEDKPVKPVPTLQELQWQLKSIETEFLYLQERQKNLQQQYKDVREQIDKMAPPKAAPAPVPDKPKDEGKKKP